MAWWWQSVWHVVHDEEAEHVTVMMRLARWWASDILLGNAKPWSKGDESWVSCLIFKWMHDKWCGRERDNGAEWGAWRWGWQGKEMATFSSTVLSHRCNAEMREMRARHFNLHWKHIVKSKTMGWSEGHDDEDNEMKRWWPLAAWC